MKDIRIFVDRPVELDAFGSLRSSAPLSVSTAERKYQSMTRERLDALVR